MSNSQVLALVFACLYAVCEILANVPVFKSSSFFQLVVNILASLANKPLPLGKSNIAVDVAKLKSGLKEKGP